MTRFGLRRFDFFQMFFRQRQLLFCSRFSLNRFREFFFGRCQFFLFHDDKEFVQFDFFRVGYHFAFPEFDFFGFDFNRYLGFRDFFFERRISWVFGQVGFGFGQLCLRAFAVLFQPL